MEHIKSASSKIRSFMIDLVRGIMIGIAFIIPGFSGGSVAAILGIYERLVSAIADIFTDFKNSIRTLLPIGVGMVVGIIALLFPLSWAIEKFPLPTVSLFVGLAIGGIPSIFDNVKGQKISCKNIIALIIPMILVLSISFLPLGHEKDLLNLSFIGFLLLFIVGILGSSALVVPGISGSMLLLILGYYNPIVNLATDHLLMGKDVGKSILVLGTAGIGIAVGFIGISVIMKILLKKCPRGTYFAIIGFIFGSIPCIYLTTAKEAGFTLNTLPSSVIHWIMCALLLIIGLLISSALVIYARKNTKK